MQIRKATSNDIYRISYLIKKNAEHVKENNYSAEQKTAWIKYNTPKQIELSLKKRITFCTFINNKMVGTIGLENGKVAGLYVSYSKTGMGIGKKLLLHLEKYAREINLKKIFLEATPVGEMFYQKNGYETVGKVTVSETN